jgi:beta-N-acetylhexosaminidase
MRQKTILTVTLVALSAVLVLLLYKQITLGRENGGGSPEATGETAGESASPETTPSAEPADTPPAEVPPTAEPTKETAATDPYAAQAEQILSGMTTWEKVCQLFIVYPEAVTGVSPTTAAGEPTKAGLGKYPVGGIVYAAQNLVSGEQTRTMVANIQSYSPIGLFIAADEEGGIVNRLMSALGTTYFQSMYNYKDDGPDTAYSNAATIAEDMVSCGFNTDFAPVADVWSNKNNTVIGKRAYSDDFSQAAVLVAAAVCGFHAGGVVCTLKHFPGHGNTNEDSHLGLAYVYKTEEELMEEELLPFISGIEAGADMVMVGHLTVTAMDDVSASLSYKIVTGLLRGKLGFDGVVITDGMGMSAVASYYTTGEAAVMAIKAGDDIILGPPSLPDAADAVMRALDTGELTIERIDESVRRILLCKLRNGIIEESAD